MPVPAGDKLFGTHYISGWRQDRSEKSRGRVKLLLNSQRQRSSDIHKHDALLRQIHPEF